MPLTQHVLLLEASQHSSLQLGCLNRLLSSICNVFSHPSSSHPASSIFAAPTITKGSQEPGPAVSDGFNHSICLKNAEHQDGLDQDCSFFQYHRSSSSQCYSSSLASSSLCHSPTFSFSARLSTSQLRSRPLLLAHSKWSNGSSTVTSLPNPLQLLGNVMLIESRAAFCTSNAEPPRPRSNSRRKISNNSNDGIDSSVKRSRSSSPAPPQALASQLQATSSSPPTPHQPTIRSLHPLILSASSVEQLEQVLQRAWWSPGAQVNTKDMSLVMNTLVKLPRHPRKVALAQRLAGLLTSVRNPSNGACLMDELDARGLATCLWAWAKINYWPEPHFMPLLEKAVEVFAKGAAQGNVQPLRIALTSWAVAQAWQQRALPEQLTEDVVTRVQLRLQRAAAEVPLGIWRESISTWQNVANLLWAGAIHGVLDEQWAAAAVQHTMHFMALGQPFKSQALSNSVWALAKLGYQGQGVEELLRAAVPAILQGHVWQGPTTQDMSNTLYAYALFGCYDEALCQHLGGLFVRLLDEEAAGRPVRPCKPQECSNLLWAYAQLGYYDEKLFSRVLRHMVSLLHDLKPMEIANTLLAMATTYHMDDGVMAVVSALTPHVERKLHAFTSQTLCNSLWALAVLGLPAHPTARALACEVHSRMAGYLLGRDASDGGGPQGMVAWDEKDPRLQQLSQLWQWHQELQDQGLGHLGLQGELREGARQACIKRDGYHFGASPTQLRMAKFIQQAGYPQVEVEGRTPDGMFCTDILVTLEDGSKVAAEFDGPYHYMKQPEMRSNGNTRIRNRQLGRLKQRGLAGVVVVSHHEWNGKTDAQLVELMKKKMQAVVGK